MDELAERIRMELAAKQAISSIRNLTVLVCAATSSIVLQGRAPDYYRKQLAQTFAMQFLAGAAGVVNEIEVS